MNSKEAPFSEGIGDDTHYFLDDSVVDDAPNSKKWNNIKDFINSEDFSKKNNNTREYKHWRGDLNAFEI